MHRIYSYFYPYKDEPVLDYVRDLRENFGVAYNAVMSMAINLKIENNEIGLRDDVNINTIDSRWQHDSIPKFIALLNEFYQKKDFHKFLTNHMDLYEKSVDNFSNNVLNKINFNWFEEFYGTKSPEKQLLMDSCCKVKTKYELFDFFSCCILLFGSRKL